MEQVDRLIAAAKQTLCVVLPRGGVRDPFLFEHSLRVWLAADHIRLLSEVANLRVDRQALKAACLFHDAGWVADYRKGKIDPWQFLSSATSDWQRSAGADLLRENLADILPPRQLQLAWQAINECNLRNTDLTEAQILAEAENLEELGPLGVWKSIRSSLSTGQGVADVLDRWARQQQYNYWPARINKGFRFEATRALARQRLEVMDRFMADLAAANDGEDLKAIFAPADHPAGKTDQGASR